MKKKNIFNFEIIIIMWYPSEGLRVKESPRGVCLGLELEDPDITLERIVWLLTAGLIMDRGRAHILTLDDPLGYVKDTFGVTRYASHPDVYVHLEDYNYVFRIYGQIEPSVLFSMSHEEILRLREQSTDPLEGITGEFWANPFAVLHLNPGVTYDYSPRALTAMRNYLVGADPFSLDVADPAEISRLSAELVRRNLVVPRGDLVVPRGSVDVVPAPLPPLHPTFAEICVAARAKGTTITPAATPVVTPVDAPDPGYLSLYMFPTRQGVVYDGLSPNRLSKAGRGVVGVVFVFGSRMELMRAETLPALPPETGSRLGVVAREVQKVLKDVHVFQATFVQ